MFSSVLFNEQFNWPPAEIDFILMGGVLTKLSNRNDAVESYTISTFGLCCETPITSQ